jgi:hypothetical protein
MAVDNSTQNVSISGANGTDFNIDVTNCNLLQDTTIQDFVGFVNGNQQSDSNFEKLSQTTIKYVGPSLSNASVSIRRVTPPDRVQEISFGSRFSSALWEAELNRSSRRAYEYELNGAPGGASFSAPSIQDDAFSSSWDGNTSDGASKNALYDIITTKADIKDETFKGKPKLNSQPAAGLSNNRLITAGWCQNEFLDQNEGDSRYLNEGSNLNDVPQPATARNNLGLGTNSTLDTNFIKANIYQDYTHGTFEITENNWVTDFSKGNANTNNGVLDLVDPGIYLFTAKVNDDNPSNSPDDDYKILELNMQDGDGNEENLLLHFLSGATMVLPTYGSSTSLNLTSSQTDINLILKQDNNNSDTRRFKLELNAIKVG